MTRPPLRNATISTNIESLALPAFINEAFGNQLGINFQLDPGVATRTEIVTLRLPSEQSASSYYDLVVDVLRSYQVRVEWDGDLLKVTPEASGVGEAPIIVSGRGTPNVPSSHRPLFQLVELENVAAGNVSGWLRSAFEGQVLKIEDDLNRNAVVLVGKPALVQQAVEAIRVLDRPFMRGRFSARLEPAFVGASDLAKRISEIMLAQGFAVGTQIGPGSGTLLLPIESSNAVLVFAPTREILRYVQDWAVSIDAPGAENGGSNGLFYYMMRNTQAQDVAQVLTGLGNATQAADSPPPLAPSTSQPAAAQQPAQTASVAGASTLLGGKLTVDGSRNALIFQGNANEWQRVLPLIRQMDQPARQVMVEVTIAEVTLRDSDNFGVNWAGTDSPGRFDGRFTFGTLNSATTTPGSGTSSGGSGLTYLLNVGAETRARLTALAQDSRLSVLSTPRLMVKSGDEANIEIGDEVPTLTSTSVGPQQSGGTTTTLQSIQYRKTGILLNIKPTVYSDDRVDLEINQEVSDVNPDAAVEGISSPAIFNRSVSTSLTLKDGASLLLGGLMSNRQTRSDNGIPAIKDVPLLGHLFKSQTRAVNRTELVLIITPYIVENDADASAITTAIRNQLELVELPPVDADLPVGNTRVIDTPQP
ncbi:secretin N-terminal domain-containing protein [Silanimonas sp.]|uniref:secretin N-terminal domain-containing protein n=1 Tax=Silanimonas sp. TaxID=1929290 RepID=UPI00260A3483|nr:secretin N-terminal domain-containing protein [Silanimonas sp.]